MSIDSLLRFTPSPIAHNVVNQAFNNDFKRMPSINSDDNELEQLFEAFKQQGFQGLRQVKLMPSIGEVPINILNIWPLMPMENNQFQRTFNAATQSVNFQPTRFSWIRQDGFVGYYVFCNPNFCN